MAAKVTWTEEQIFLLCRLFHSHTNAECAQLVGHSIDAVRKKAKQLHLKKDKDWMYEKTSKGMFKKGHVPYNKVGLGHKRKGRDGYWLVKVAEPNVFRPMHLVLWEQFYGPLSKGDVVSFIDGNRDNVCISNLRCETKKEKFFRCCSIHTTLPPDIRELVMLKGKLKRQINKLENNNGKKDRTKRNRKARPDEEPPVGVQKPDR